VVAPVSAPTLPSTGPAYATTDDDGHRWYVFPDDPQRYLSVSTATGVIGSEGLMVWAASLAATAAFIELPTILTASRKKPCERTYNQCAKEHGWQARCDRCPCAVCRACVAKWLRDLHRAESSRRADEGTRVHDVIEWWALHDGQIKDHGEDIAPYVRAFLAFVAEYGLTPASFLMSEGTVINRAHRYAGTSDGIIRFDARATKAAAELVARVRFAIGEYPEHAEDRDALLAAVVADHRTVDLVFDAKTKEKTKEEAKGRVDFYAEHALQVTGYRHAPVVRIKGTTVEVAMPDTDGGLILQLRPDGCTARLMVTDDATFEAFLNAVGLCRWLLELGAKATQVGAFPLPPKAARPRKAAPAKKTAPVAKATPTKAAAAPATTSRRRSTSASLDPFADRRGDRPAGARLDDTDIPF
jgi:hypothetical protein